MPPGRYTLVGRIPWVEGMLTTEPVSIEVIDSRDLKDREAGELVDGEFASFLAGTDMIMGLTRDGEPRGSVSQILQMYPDSVQARYARSRLVYLRIRRFLSGGTGKSVAIRTEREAVMLKLVQTVDTQLAQNPDDPLERDLLHGKVQLLRRFEKTDLLRAALDGVIDRYPESVYANQARRMKDAMIRPERR